MMSIIYLLFLIILFIGLLMSSILFIIFLSNDKGGVMEEEKSEQLYPGPVPEGYDEEHFRKTGETIIMEDKK